MRKKYGRVAVAALMSAAVFSVPACSGGGGGSDAPRPAPTSGGPAPTPTPAPTTSPSPTPLSDTFQSEADVSRFLTQASFGPRPADLTAMNGMSQSAWFRNQLALQPTLHVPGVRSAVRAAEANGTEDELYNPHTNSFWQATINGEDQLRQRMAFALSQIFVVSDESDAGGFAISMADYMDILGENAFGNYRDLIEAITYSPAMAFNLTYMNNRPADEETGVMPDENYAREIMQLFSIGLVELNMDGSVRTDGSGQPIETYTNDDVRGLARVFTGLSFDSTQFWDWYENRAETADHSRLLMWDDFHSSREKTFLGVTIPANTAGDESIRIALDTLAEHDNTPPFISRQLIQRFVTSHPSPDYVERVADVFVAGRYTLPDSTVIGDGRRGDLAATLAAILFDRVATNGENTDPTHGRIREPILRFVHWARAMGVSNGDSRPLWQLNWGQSPEVLGQLPYRSPSVFNFYRPGYIAPGTATGEAELTAPELQITNSSSIMGFAGTLESFQRGWAQHDDDGEIPNYRPDLTLELSLADQPEQLVDRLDLLLTAGRMEPETRDRIIAVLNEMEIAPFDSDTEDEDRRARVDVAVSMVLSTPEFIVLR